MYADINIPTLTLSDGIYWTGIHTLTATNTHFPTHHHSAARTLSQRTSRAGRGTGSRLTGQAPDSNKAGGQPSGRLYSDTSRMPRQPSLNKPGTSHGTGMAADALIHSWCC